MILLHHLRIGRSLFTVWQLEELGIKYSLKVYHRNPETFLAPIELKAVHPLGKSPVLEDGSLLLSESSAITTYLLEKFDTENKFSPPREDIFNWANFTQWLHYPEGSVFCPLLVRMLLLRSKEPHATLTPYSEREVALHLTNIANQLGENEYILGDKFTAADFGVTYIVSLAKRLGLLHSYESLNNYLEKNLARNAFKQAVERAVE